MNNTNNTSESIDQSLIGGKIRSKMRLTKANAFKLQMKQEAEKKALQEAEFKLHNAKSHVLTIINKTATNKTMSQYDLCQRKDDNQEKKYLNKLIIGNNKAKVSGIIKVNEVDSIKPQQSEYKFQEAKLLREKVETRVHDNKVPEKNTSKTHRIVHYNM